MADQFGYLKGASSDSDAHGTHSDLPDTQGSPASLIREPLPLTPLLEVSHVCALFGRNERSIRRWIRAGHLTPIRVGRAMFFEPEDIRALIATRLRR